MRVSTSIDCAAYVVYFSPGASVYVAMYVTRAGRYASFFDRGSLLHC